MNIKSVYSKHAEPKKAVEDIQKQLKTFDTQFIVYFASNLYDQKELNAAFKKLFPHTPLMGCSSAGEIANGNMMEHSLVAMAFNSEIVEDVQIEVITSLKEDKGEGVLKAFQQFEKHYGESSYEMNPEKYLGMVLFDWIAASEEKTMNKIGDLTDVHFIGGSAADNLKFEKTYVYANGEVYTNAAILALLKVKNGFDFVKTQNFRSSGKKLVATRVDLETRTVFEFNGKPAAQAYAESLDTTVDKLPDSFFHHPVGLEIIEDNIMVRSPQKVDENNSVRFFCNIGEGARLSVLNPINVVEETKRVFDEKVKELQGQVSGIIDFQCILRTLDLRNQNLTTDYAQIFANYPMIGFSSYGQQHIGHLDQTSMILIFK